MTPPIAIFYHVLLRLGNPPEVLPQAMDIVREQMHQLESVGLLDNATEFHVGLNDNEEGLEYAQLFIPPKAQIRLHGLESRSECLTIIQIEEWVRTHPGWLVLYIHTKGATHSANDSYSIGVVKPWRDIMMKDLVYDWSYCTSFLQTGYDVVCSRFMPGMADGTQNIVPGNFWWARSDFLRMLPSLFWRTRIRESGIGALESRFEAEVWIGNGPRLPRVIEFRKNWDPRRGNVQHAY